LKLDPALGRNKVPITFLSVGSSILKIGLHPKAVRRQGRANDVADVWRQLSRLHGADRSGLPADTLKYVPIDLWDRPGAKSLNFSAISAPYGKKRLSGLPTPRSIHCRRGERPVISMRVR